MPTHKRHFARGRLRHLTQHYLSLRRELFESDRLARFQTSLWGAELRSAPARESIEKVLGYTCEHIVS
jgi:hypothetical protein